MTERDWLVRFRLEIVRYTKTTAEPVTRTDFPMVMNLLERKIAEHESGFSTTAIEFDHTGRVFVQGTVRASAHLIAIERAHTAVTVALSDHDMHVADIVGAEAHVIENIRDAAPLMLIDLDPQ